MIIEELCIKKVPTQKLMSPLREWELHLNLRIIILMLVFVQFCGQLLKINIKILKRDRDKPLNDLRAGKNCLIAGIQTSLTCLVKCTDCW